MTELVKSMSLNDFRSPSDRKNYRVIRLENELEVLLIQHEVTEEELQKEMLMEEEPEPEHHEWHDSSENDEDKSDIEGNDDELEHHVSGGRHAAACMSVGMGSMVDPQEIKGLAHYLEHMLFMGSEKYPDENEFESFLSTHGGYSNGCTNPETTQYLFEVGPPQLKQALDMFAQFFISPLFKKEAMERELLAIESEYNRAMNNDYVRLQQIQCETCKEDHPYRTFTWGNTESLKTIPEKLGINVRDAMIQHFKRYYSAHIMKLVVYGENSLNEMEEWVKESFSPIPHRKTMELPFFSSIPRPFGMDAKQKPTVLKIIPVKKMYAMHLYWTLPNVMHLYRQKPWDYIAQLLGAECSGSITDVLNQKGWATHVVSGISERDGYEFGSFGALFEVNISLTHQGMNNWEEVVGILFDYLHFATVFLHEWIFHELKISTEMNFHFQEEMDPLCLCKLLSHLMQARFKIQHQDLLRYDLLQDAFDPEAVKQILSFMIPANTRILLLSDTFEVPNIKHFQTERWIGAKYTSNSIDQATLERWQNGNSKKYHNYLPFALPSRNPFMPENFELLPLDKEDEMNDNKATIDCLPELLCVTPMSKVWYKRDRIFLIPKVNIHFMLCLPSISISVEHFVSTKILIKMFNDSLKEVHFQASLANLEYEILLNDLEDLEINFSGFNDKIGLLIVQIFEHLLTPSSTWLQVQRFILMKDELVQEYRNVNLKPSIKARYMRLQLLERMTFSIEDILETLNTLHFEQIITFYDTKLWNCEIALRSLIHGNLTRIQAKEILLQVEEIIDHRTYERRLPPLSPVRSHTIELPITTNGILLREMSDHVEETNTTVEVYYQFGKAISFQDYAYADLLQQLMSEPLFYHLRTKQQLGYEVYCRRLDTNGVLGFTISVQSASHPSGEIALCIDRFVHEEFIQILKEMSCITFKHHVDAIKRLKSQKDTNLTEETYRYWEEIQSRTYEFHAIKEIVNSFDECTKEQLIERYIKWMLKDTLIEEEGTRKLRVHVIGKNCKQYLPIEKLVNEDQVPHLIDNLKEYKKTLRCHI